MQGDTNEMLAFSKLRKHHAVQQQTYVYQKKRKKKEKLQFGEKMSQSQHSDREISDRRQRLLNDTVESTFDLG